MKRFGLLAHFIIWVAVLFLEFHPGYGFYVSHGVPRKYVNGDTLFLRVNSLTSVNSALPLSHYSLPFCKPISGVRDSALNLGQLLVGDRIQNSPYRVKMNANESGIFVCQSDHLSVGDVESLKKRIDDLYQVNLLLDNLPAVRFVAFEGARYRWNGIPVGFKVEDNYYVLNHLKLKVLVHKEVEGSNAPVFTIVGFEVVPCSYRHEDSAANRLGMNDRFPQPIKCDHNIVAKEIKESERIAFSYEVTFEESEITWQSRWDSYLQMEAHGLHWLPISISLLVIAFLSRVVLVILRKTPDIKGNGYLNGKSQGTLKLMEGNALCAPAFPMLLCVAVGSGVQILVMAFVTVLLAALGFMSPASRVDLLTNMIILYLVSGIAAGYIAVRLWRMIGDDIEKGWASVSWRVACFFPGIVLAMLTTLNFILAGSNSTAEISFFSFVVMVLLWSGIALPLTFIGGYIGASARHLENPSPFNEITKEVPLRRSFMSCVLLLGAGLLPFSTLFLELVLILGSRWLGRYYYAFGSLFIVILLAIIVCAEVSIVCTFKHLSRGDRQWWWKSFFASGSTAVYVLLYLINYLAFDLMYLNGPVSAALYLGYSLLVAVAVMLATGSVGFLSAFWFLHYLFSSAALPYAKISAFFGDAPVHGDKEVIP